MQSVSNRHLSYRPDIDGLRALAVLGVVFFHARLGVPGGFVGVDVFFVISGFLITSLILKDLRKGTFSMVGFWERRVRRIFPALAVVVASCLVAGWFLLLHFGYLVLAQAVISLSVFVSNIQFWRTMNYFSPWAEENPLLHTWSLSVEEQFYLIVPLVLAGLYSWRKEKPLLPAILIGVVLSFIASIYWLRIDPAGAFYLLPSRAWELGLGSLLALARPLRRVGLRLSVGGVGLFGILYAFVCYGSSTPFPGLAAVPPVLGAALVVWSGALEQGDQPSPLHLLLAWRPFVWVGLLSYSLYLWHWPFFAFHRYLFGGPPDVALSIGYVAASFLLSVLSLYFVERPFRSRKVAASRKAIFTFFLVTTGALMLFSLYVYRSEGIPSRIPKTTVKLVLLEGRAKGRVNNELAARTTQVRRLGGAEAPCQFLVWGDSHTVMLLGSLDALCNELEIAGVAVTRGGTPPTFAWRGEPETTSAHLDSLLGGETVRNLVKTGRKTGELKTVFLVFRWSYYVRRNPPLDVSRVPVGGFADALIETVKEFRNNGLNVIVMNEVPIFRSDVGRSVALHEWIGTPLPSLSRTDHEKFIEPYTEIINRIKREVPDVQFMDPSPFLFSKDDNVEFMDSDGFLLYRDSNHLTLRAVKRLEPAFRDALSK
ncbi:MAG: acyltransferase family protein [bacterium]